MARGKVKNNELCPHDWKNVTIDGTAFAQCCICHIVAVAVVMR